MGTSSPNSPTPATADLAAGVRQYLLKGLVAKLVMAVILFLSAGRLDWTMGWLLFAVYVTWDIVVALLLIPRSPGMIAERSGIQPGTKKWDIVLTTIAASLLPMITWAVAGLDVRFRWTQPFPPPLRIAALTVVILGFALVTWAMASNEFFSALVRIQHDRNHTVASSGPYRIIRHPGYVAAILFGLGSPVMLGSLWALLPAGLSTLLYVVRTELEDRTLHEELAGYPDYARSVRYRLLPGIW
jgi:protein-S-isoprenylcysteine O-methyltransferase Ste14